MEHINQLQQQLGLMTWPLLLCSLIVVMIIVERSLQVVLSVGIGKRDISKRLQTLTPQQHTQLDRYACELAGKRAPLYQGVAMLLAHRTFTRELREDVAAMWLQSRRHQLNFGLRILTLIGVISPLIGLLGTVLGLIDMFKGVAASTSGNITPNDLAAGLGLAMRTTATGLIIALPAIASAQLFGLWADRIMARLEHSLNYVNLWLEGINWQSAAQPNTTELTQTAAGACS